MSIKVFWDIETIPAGDKLPLSEIEADSRLKDPAKIEKDKFRKQAKEYSDRSLHALDGQILCIGYAIEDDPAQCTTVLAPTDERATLSALEAHLAEAVNPTGGVTFVQFGDFDARWIALRAMRYRLPWLAVHLRPGRYGRGNVRDVRELLSFGVFKAEGSLAGYAKFFGLGGKDAGLDGSKVHQAWRNGRFRDIEDYCKRDVEILRELDRILVWAGK